MASLFCKCKKISFDIKSKAGFGKGGEKNFDGVITELQMMTYLCMRDFRKKILDHMMEMYPIASENQIRKVLTLPV